MRIRFFWTTRTAQGRKPLACRSSETASSYAGLSVALRLPQAAKIAAAAAPSAVPTPASCSRRLATIRGDPALFGLGSLAQNKYLLQGRGRQLSVIRLAIRAAFAPTRSIKWRAPMIYHSTTQLVIVRAGDQSLHNQWMMGPDLPRFDLAVSYYGYGELPESRAAFVHRYVGGKWDGLYSFFESNPELLDKYEWIWLPDDDIAADTRNINHLFDMARQCQLKLAQPSLSWNSYYSHLLTLNNPRFIVRYTNFIELMAPLFHRSLLQKILPAFRGRRFGFGLDFYWSRWIEQPFMASGIIDTLTVTHTKPVSRGQLYNASSHTPKLEARRLFDYYGYRRDPNKVIYCGRDRNHGLINDRARLMYNLYMGWQPLAWSPFKDPHLPLGTRRLLDKVRKTVMRRYDLSPLEVPPIEIIHPTWREHQESFPP